MRILVIFTGGTIGSKSGDHIALKGQPPYALLDNFKKCDPNADVTFEALAPYSILSENLSHKELNALCKLAQEELKKGYDGIIITHGTDTIQYTANAIALTTACGKTPIVLVSANRPLDNKLSNGNANFFAAVKFIEQKSGAGVFIAYKNDGDELTAIHRAKEAVTHLEGNDGLYSLSVPYAKVDGEGKIALLQDKLAVDEGENIPARFTNSPKTLVINAMPGDSFDYKLKGYKAVIIKPYHSGTLDVNNARLFKFLEKAKGLDAPVFIPHGWEGAPYESVKALEERNAIMLKKCAFPHLYLKIWLAISLKREVRLFVNEHYD